MDKALSLRGQLLDCRCVTFRAKITADYGESVQSFTLDCQGDSQGKLTFFVAEPEVIAGITGSFADGTGALTFDDAVLEFPGLADGQLPPVSGPWVLLNTLRSGYITSCAQGEGYLQITLEDRFRDEDLTMDIWLDGENCPIRGEIGWDGRRVLTMEIADFVIS